MAESPTLFQPLEDKLQELHSEPVHASQLPAHSGGGEFPSDLVDRIRRGIEARGFYVFGRDDLGAVWGDTAAHPAREKILRRFATAVDADLQPGWTPNVALLIRPGSAR